LPSAALLVRFAPANLSPAPGLGSAAMPRLWIAMMVILIACLIASVVIATVKLT
jgi:hypothetical protein